MPFLMFVLNFLIYAALFFAGSVVAQLVAQKLYPARNEDEALAELDARLAEGAHR